MLFRLRINHPAQSEDLGFMAARPHGDDLTDAWKRLIRERRSMRAPAGAA
jgi:hypothetical protein